MFNRHYFYMTWGSKRTLLIVLIGLAVLGQSCSVSFGNSQPKDGGIYRTDDQAETWKQKVFIRTEKNRRLGLDDATVVFLQPDPRDSDRLYAGVRGRGVWVSDDGGEKWTVTGLKTGTYRCLSFDLSNDQIMYMAGGNQVRKSLDRGKTWTIVYTEPQTKQTIECAVVDPQRGNIVWTVTSGGKIVRSADYGINWTLVNTVPAVTGVIKLDIDPVSNGLVVFTSRRGIHRLDASGTQAVDLSAALDLYKGARSVADVEIVRGLAGSAWYLATSFGVLASTDSGGSWREVSTLLNPNSTAISNLAVNPSNLNEIYLTTGRRLHRTADGGASWAVTTLPSTRQPVWLLVDRVNSDRLYVGTFVAEK